MNPDPQAEAGTRQEDDELARLVGRAERGDLTVLPALREALSSHPHVWQAYGDVSLQAEGALVRAAAGRNLLLAESLLFKLRELKGELAGDARLRALQRLQDAAHRRHLAGIKQLAVVRRLLRPAPSPLELLRAPVAEASPAPATPRRDAGLPLCGSGVEN